MDSSQTFFGKLTGFLLVPLLAACSASSGGIFFGGESRSEAQTQKNATGESSDGPGDKNFSAASSTEELQEDPEQKNSGSSAPPVNVAGAWLLGLSCAQVDQNGQTEVMCLALNESYKSLQWPELQPIVVLGASGHPDSPGATFSRRLDSIETEADSLLKFSAPAGLGEIAIAVKNPQGIYELLNFKMEVKQSTLGPLITGVYARSSEPAPAAVAQLMIDRLATNLSGNISGNISGSDRGRKQQLGEYVQVQSDPVKTLADLLNGNLVTGSFGRRPQPPPPPLPSPPSPPVVPSPVPNPGSASTDPFQPSPMPSTSPSPGSSSVTTPAACYTSPSFFELPLNISASSSCTDQVESGRFQFGAMNGLTAIESVVNFASQAPFSTSLSSYICRIEVTATEAAFQHDDVFFLSVNGYVAATNQVPTGFVPNVRSRLNTSSLLSSLFIATNATKSTKYCLAGASCTLPDAFSSVPSLLSVGLNLDASSGFFDPVNDRSLKLDLTVLSEMRPGNSGSCSNSGIRASMRVYTVPL